MSHIQFYICLAALSVTIAYAFWVKIRVWKLREDLFEIRDRLWDDMRERNELDHPDHREVRESINNLIRLAPLLSLGTIAIMLVAKQEAPVAKSSLSVDAVKKAQFETVRRVVEYCFKSTLLGFFVYMSAGVIRFAKPVKAAMERSISSLLSSEETADLAKNCLQS